MNNNKAAGITVLADETIAYLAQAFYLVAANGNMPDDPAAPDYKAVEIVQRVRDGRLRTNIGTIATLDDAVAAFNPTKRTNGKTIIRVRP